MKSIWRAVCRAMGIHTAYDRGNAYARALMGKGVSPQSLEHYVRTEVHEITDYERGILDHCQAVRNSSK